jgi:hypothetical protein
MGAFTSVFFQSRSRLALASLQGHRILIFPNLLLRAVHAWIQRGEVRVPTQEPIGHSSSFFRRTCTLAMAGLRGSASKQQDRAAHSRPARALRIAPDIFTRPLRKRPVRFDVLVATVIPFFADGTPGRANRRIGRPKRKARQMLRRFRRLGRQHQRVTIDILEPGLAQYVECPVRYDRQRVAIQIFQNLLAPLADE